MISIPSSYIREMQTIKKSISSYPGYEAIASCLGEFVNQNIVAGLIGCIVPESGTNHRILNVREYNGRGASGTSGWNCGEGLIQWTYWKNKRPLIVKYNNDSRSTQKLPTDWATYSQGTPVKENGALVAVSDGRHIAGLSLKNQMLFLIIYYNDLIKKLGNEQIYYAVDVITDAINLSRQIRFQYYDYLPTKEKILKNEEEYYYLSPVAMIWDDNHYYVIGHSEKHPEPFIINFRIDRICHAEITEEPSMLPEDGFSVEEYVNRQFRMNVGECIRGGRYRSSSGVQE